MATLVDLFSELQGATAVWTELYGLLKTAGYNTNAERPAIDSLTVDNLNRRAVLVLELLDSLRPENPADLSATLLELRKNDIHGNLGAFRKNSQAIVNSIKPHIKEGVSASDGNNNFSINFSSDKNQFASVELSGHFTPVNQALNQLLILVTPISSLCKTSGASDLLERAQVFAGLINSANEEVAKIKGLVELALKNETDVEALQKRIQEYDATAQTIHAKLSATQQQMEKEASSVSALVEKIKAIGTSADTLEKQVAGYTATFEAFQKQLDDRIKLFNQFTENTQQALEQSKKQDEEIDRLTAKADSMIRGATTAGLSKSLDDSRKVYADRMFWARIGFLGSIFVLLVSALPLAADLFPGLLGDYLKGKLGQQNDSLIPVIGKIFLLFPGTWLTLFFAKSFSEFFHLEREYAHKAALAKSVEGFKREAPAFSEVITSSVFAEILNNPSSRPSPEPAQHPLYEALLKKLPELLNSKNKSG